jgi:hypothetical protein
VLPVLLGLLVAATPPRPFSDERHLLDRRLEALRRILPDGPTPVADTALVKEMAEAAKLTSVEASPRPPVESGAKGDVAVDLQAVGRFAEAERFFRQVALSPRLLDVEALALTATPEDTVKLTALIHLPYRPAKAPLAATPEGTRARVAGVPKPQADVYIRDQALALAKSEAIAALRRTRRNPRLFLSELAAISRDRPVTFTYANLGDEFLVRGLTVGEGPVRALESRFERGLFRVAEFLMQRRGSCVQFEVRGRSPVAGPDAELPLPADDPFIQDDAPCRIDRDANRGPQVKGPNAKVPGKGPLSLRLRDLDWTDVFRVLHLLTGQGFLVDGDVAGRVSLDLSGVTLEEVLTALQKSGLRISEPGPLRRVALGRGPLQWKAASTGSAPTANFLLKRVDVREVLAVMTDLDPTLAALGPEGSLGRVSLWVKDLSVADLRSALLDVAGLSERFEEGRRLLERKPQGEAALVPVAAASPERRLGLRPQDLTVMEFELAGVASSPEGWLAFAYSPAGTLNAYRANDRIADGIVKTVESTDVVLETDEGSLRVLLPPQ